MTRQIWKYPVTGIGVFTVEMPKGAKVLTVDIDIKDERPCIWVVVDPDAEKEEARFLVIGTGHDFTPEDTDVYIGTFQMGPLVLHLFRRS